MVFLTPGRGHERAGRRGRAPFSERGLGSVLAMVALLAGFAALGLLESEPPRPEPGMLQSAPRPPQTSQTGATPTLTPSRSRRRDAVPTPAGLRAARRYARRREGAVSFAVVDTRGRMHGRRADRPFPAASLVKAMIMVAYLDRLDQRGEPLTSWGRGRLEAMIRRSDNAAASDLFGLVGAEGLARVARRARMKRFVASPVWGSSTVTARDQARFFRAVPRLIDSSRRREARRLLATVVPAQRWGIPRAAGRRWRVLAKAGWRPSAGGWLVNQAARLERGSLSLSIAVLTDGSPSHAYGTETVRGIATRLQER